MMPKPIRWNYVKWIDHSGYTESGWKTDEEFYALEPFIIESAGLVIKETNAYIVLVSHYSNDSGKGTGEMCILKNCIVERKGITIDDRHYQDQSSRGLPNESQSKGVPEETKGAND